MWWQPHLRFLYFCNGYEQRKPCKWGQFHIMFVERGPIKLILKVKTKSLRNIKCGFHCNAVQLSTVISVQFVHCTFQHKVHHSHTNTPQFCCNALASFATHTASSIYTFVHVIHFKLTLTKNTVICISVCVGNIIRCAANLDTWYWQGED